MLKTKKNMNVFDILLKLISLFIISLILWYTPMFTIIYEYNNSDGHIETDYYQIEYDYNFYGYNIANKTSNRNYYSIDTDIINKETVWNNWFGSIISILYSFIPLLLIINIWKYPNLKFKELIIIGLLIFGIIFMISSVYNYYISFQNSMEILENYFFSEYSFNYGDKLYIKISEEFLILPITFSLIIIISSIINDKYLKKHILLLPKDSLLQKFLIEAINKEESKLWDFKRTLEMWHVRRIDIKKAKQVSFCENFAAFANSNGGIMIIGITDKIPRKFQAIEDLEGKKQIIGKTLRKWIDFQIPPYILKEINLEYESEQRRCLFLIIAQTKNPIGVKQPDERTFSYPYRTETGKDWLNHKEILDIKFGISSNNTNFFKDINKIVN